MRPPRSFTITISIIGMLLLCALVFIFPVRQASDAAWEKLANAYAAMTAINPTQTAVFAYQTAIADQSRHVAQQATDIAAFLTEVPLTVTAVYQNHGDPYLRALAVDMVGDGILALEQYPPQPEIAALLAIRSLNTTYTPEADALLLRALNANPVMRIYGRQTTGYDVVTARFAPTGSHIMILYEGGHPHYHDLFSGVRIEDLRMALPHTLYQYALHFSPDLRTIQVRDAETARILLTLPRSRYPIRNAILSPDTRFVVTGDSQGDVVVWSRQEGQQVGSYSMPSGYAVKSVSIDSTGTLLAASVEGHDLIRSWQLPLGTNYREYYGCRAPMSQIQISPGSRYIAGVCQSFPPLLTIWETNSSQPAFQMLVSANSSSISNLTFNDAGTCLAFAASTGSGHEYTAVWKFQTVLEVAHLSAATYDEIILSPTCDFALVIDNGTARLERLLTPRSFADNTTGSNGVRIQLPVPALGAALQPLQTNGTPQRLYLSTRLGIIAGSYEHLLQIWHYGETTPTRVLYLPSTTTAYDLHLLEGLIAIGHNDGILELRESTQNSTIRTFQTAQGSIAALVIGSRQRLVSIGGDGNAYLHNFRTGELQHIFQYTEYPFTEVALDSTENQIALRDAQGHISVWNTETLTREYTLSTRMMHRFAPVFSPDGLWLATVETTHEGDVLHIWSARYGRVSLSIAITDQPFGTRDVTFSPNSERLLVVTNDFATVIERSSGALVRQVRGHSRSMRSGAFNSDGTLFATGGMDNTIRFWDVNYHEFVRRACGLIIRDLTIEERNYYNSTSLNLPTCPQFDVLGAASTLSP